MLALPLVAFWSLAISSGEASISPRVDLTCAPDELASAIKLSGNSGTYEGLSVGSDLLSPLGGLVRALLVPADVVLLALLENLGRVSFCAGTSEDGSYAVGIDIRWGHCCDG